MEDIKLNKKLAAGSQSQVYMGSFEGKDVAVKVSRLY
jgi:predicted unusual protein kinase regulating ubiquinone biosynthesis (AarF/ABC1/UbiB family)